MPEEKPIQPNEINRNIPEELRNLQETVQMICRKSDHPSDWHIALEQKLLEEVARIKKNFSIAEGFDLTLESRIAALQQRIISLETDTLRKTVFQDRYIPSAKEWETLLKRLVALEDQLALKDAIILLVQGLQSVSDQMLKNSL